VLEALGEVRQVGTELTQSEGDFGDGPAGDADAVFGDVKQCPDTVCLFLNAIPGVVPFEGTRFLIVQVVPVAEEHRLDLFREQHPRMLGGPEVVAEGVEVRLLGRSTLGRHNDAVLVAKGLKFGQGFRHGSVLVGVRTDYSSDQPLLGGERGNYFWCCLDRR
jgi:hypothetical protein